MKKYDVAIVGAGHAGAQAAIALRQYGFSGSIGLIGEERELPYERPPLSKDYLAGEKAFERMMIRPERFWAEREIDLVQGHRITAVEPDARQLRSAEGAAFAYRNLIWAAGGRARSLTCEGSDLKGVYSIRTRGDVDRIKANLAMARRIAIIGGGYIGLEAAAVLRTMGKEVVLVEAMDRVLARVAGGEISRFLETEHRKNGVEIRLNEHVQALSGRSGHVAAVELSGADHIPADLVIVGIGIAPEVEPLLAAGCSGIDGVDVDEYCRTTVPTIFAVGDCARHRNLFAGGADVRIESVQNAHDQATTAVKAILDISEPYRAVPWFWSNQYDLKLQTVGLSAGYDQTLLRGRLQDRSFSVVYLKESRVIALDCINATKDYVHGRKLILDQTKPDPPRLADPAIPLKDLL